MSKIHAPYRINALRNVGFTLVELLVVMVISVTIISLTTVAYNKLSTNAYLKSSARHVAASLRYTRSYAVARGVESVLRIDLKNRSYSFTGNNQTFEFRNNVNLDVFSASSLGKSNDIAEIRFASDGSSSGGRVSLSSRDKKYVVYVDWLTGRIGVDG